MGYYVDLLQCTPIAHDNRCEAIATRRPLQWYATRRVGVAEVASHVAVQSREEKKYEQGESLVSDVKRRRPSGHVVLIASRVWVSRGVRRWVYVVLCVVPNCLAVS
jgi:hypothetical protein